ncbi:MAG: DUF4180 domain-containing protein [Turneriella sp.]
MNHTTHQFSGHVAVEIISDIHLLSNAGDALGLIHDNGTGFIILHQQNLHPDFFVLANGVAGDICQKFVNYRCHLAIVGDYTKVESASLRDFIFESNKGSFVMFPATVAEALQKFGDRIGAIR